MRYINLLLALFLSLRECVTEGQMANKKHPECDMWISCVFQRIPWECRCACGFYGKASVLGANLYSVFAVP